jgi:hypothetical protein
MAPEDAVRTPKIWRRVREARAMFERLLALWNELAEEYDPRTRRKMGNFPQAFSHVALVNTAYNFTRSEGPAEVRAGRKPLTGARGRSPSPSRNRGDIGKVATAHC